MTRLQKACAKNGHEPLREYIYVDSNGIRRCRLCERARSKEWKSARHHQWRLDRQKYAKRRTITCHTCGKDFVERYWGKKKPAKFCSRKCCCDYLHELALRKYAGKFCPNHPERKVCCNGLCKNCAERKRLENPVVREKHRKRATLYRATIPKEILHARSIHAHYGLTAAEHKAMFIAQDGKCPICHEARKLEVDHCHTTGTVRSLLCRRCNQLVGYIEKSADGVIERAIAYVQGHKQNRLGYRNHDDLGTSVV